MKIVLRKQPFICITLFLFLYSCNTPREGEQSTSTTSWQKLGPGGGGSTFIPTFSFQSPDHFVIRCDMSGSYITSNGGSSYHQVNFPNGASAYAFDPADKNTIYIGGTFLHRSKDGGKTWEQLFPKKEDITNETWFSDHASYYATAKDTNLYKSGSHVSAIRIDPSNSQTIYIAMGPNLLYSNDNGQTWRKQPFEQKIISLFITKEKPLYIFTANSVFTFDKASHQIQEHALPAEMSPVFSYAAGTIKGSDKTVMYALHHDVTKPVEGEFGYSEIWTSGDDGNTWQRITDTTITNAHSGIDPSYSMIACAEADARSAIGRRNRRERTARSAGSGCSVGIGAGVAMGQRCSPFRE